MNTFLAIYHWDNGYDCSCCKKEGTETETFEFTAWDNEEEMIATAKKSAMDWGQDKGYTLVALYKIGENLV